VVAITITIRVSLCHSDLSIFACPVDAILPNAHINSLVTCFPFLNYYTTITAPAPAPAPAADAVAVAVAAAIDVDVAVAVA
jgi:hypothetical protein